MGRWQRSILWECIKHRELGGNRAIDLHAYNIQIIVELTFKDNRLPLIVNMTVFTKEMNCGAVMHEVGDGEQVAIKIWDVEDVLQHRFDPLSLCKYLNFNAACAYCGDSAIVAKNDFGVL